MSRQIIKSLLLKIQCNKKFTSYPEIFACLFFCNFLSRFFTHFYYKTWNVLFFILVEFYFLCKSRSLYSPAECKIWHIKKYIFHIVITRIELRREFGSEYSSLSKISEFSNEKGNKNNFYKTITLIRFNVIRTVHLFEISLLFLFNVETT